MPHGGLAVHALWGADLFATTGRHWPVVFAACPFNVAVQAEQPVHAVAQQTPSAMIPDVHSYV
jgi:hypothetical protein